MITVAYAKATWLGITADTSQDSLITTLIDAATVELEDYCGQPLKAVTDHVIAIPKLDHTTCHLPLQGIPVTVTGLEYRKKPTDSWTASSAGTFAAHKDRAGWWLYSTDYFVQPYYQVTVDCGFTVDSDVPASLQQACGILVKEAFLASGSSGTPDRFGLASKSDSNPSGSVAEALQSIKPQVHALVAPYVVRDRP